MKKTLFLACIVFSVFFLSSLLKAEDKTKHALRNSQLLEKYKKYFNNSSRYQILGDYKTEYVQGFWIITEDMKINALIAFEIGNVVRHDVLIRLIQIKNPEGEDKKLLGIIRDLMGNYDFYYLDPRYFSPTTEQPIKKDVKPYSVYYEVDGVFDIYAKEVENLFKFFNDGP